MNLSIILPILILVLLILLICTKEHFSENDMFNLNNVSSKGLNGNKGDKGDRGEKGLKGDTGPRGYTGSRGPQGIRGIQGPPGSPGLAGKSGVSSISNTCYPNSGSRKCNSGYLPRIDPKNIRWWACGKNCTGGKNLTDGSCNCACVPENQCSNTVKLKPSWKALGSYRDTGNRSLRYGPHRYGHTPESCRASCPGFKYFALQAGNWCSCEHSYAHATKYGKHPNYCGPGGAGWCNYLYENLKVE